MLSSYTPVATLPTSDLAQARRFYEDTLGLTVLRDGTMQDVRILKSSGTLALDRAAQNALLGSRLQPLPADYGPPSVTMKVSFHYNEGPSRS